MHDFLTKKGVGYAAVIGGHTDTDYYIFLNNASLDPYPYMEVPEPNVLLTIDEKDYDIIATTFRVYTKSAFLEYEPSLMECMAVLEHKIEQHYARIYCGDEWHKIFFRAN